MTKQKLQANLAPEEGWQELVFPKEYGMGRSYVGGDNDANRLQVKYFIRKEDKRFFAKVFFGTNAQGPPAHAHGGSMAAVLDEAMGLGAWAADQSVVAAKVSIEYLRMLPLNTYTIVEVILDKIEGRKVWMRADIKDANGKVYSKGEGLYINVPREKLLNNEFHQKLVEQVRNL